MWNADSKHSPLTIAASLKQILLFDMLCFEYKYVLFGKIVNLSNYKNL